MRKFLARFLFATFLLLGVFTLPHYGINWDSINHLTRGQSYLNFFLTGKHDFSNLPKFEHYWQNPDKLGISSDIPLTQTPARSFYQNDGTTYDWVLIHDAGHPVLSDILSSVFNKVLFGQLKLINDIDSYRVYGVFLAACLVALVFWWVSGIYGNLAGFVSAISLFLYPLFWSESHFNTQKDIPETAYWSFFLFSLWKGLDKKNYKWILASGLFFGLALGTKFNILFSIFIVLPWLILVLKKSFFKNRKLVLSLLAVPIIGILMFYVTWPFLWQDLIGKTLEIIGYYKNMGLASNINPNFLGPFGTNTYPVKWILYTTPIVILFFFVIGFVFALRRIKRDKTKSSLLFLLWFIVPILRVSWPGTTIYGGIRQIMEYIPAMAILSGIGVYALRKYFSHKKIFAFLTLLSFIPLTIKLIQIHPNENVYFNPLIGGLSGAKEAEIPFWGNSFGAAYRQGVNWINQNAEDGATVVMNFGLMPDIPTIWFREDLRYSNALRSGYLMKGEYAISLVYQGTAERSYYDMYLEKFLEPVYQVQVDGVAILKVWKNDEEHLRVPWNEAVYRGVSYSKEDFGIRFFLNQPQKISKLEISYNEFNCKPLNNAVVRISKYGRNWTTLYGSLTDEWLVPVMGKQPKDGNFIEPFVGQEVGYIDLVFSPNDACLGRINSFVLHTFER